MLLSRFFKVLMATTLLLDWVNCWFTGEPPRPKVLVELWVKYMLRDTRLWLLIRYFFKEIRSFALIAGLPAQKKKPRNIIQVQYEFHSPSMNFENLEFIKSYPNHAYLEMFGYCYVNLDQRYDLRTLLQKHQNLKLRKYSSMLGVLSLEFSGKIKH